METDAARWTRRVGDAATEAVLAGADPADLLAAVQAGIREGQRVHALRNPAATPAQAPRPTTVTPAAGSAVERLLRATNAA
ncbi:hypothetical protein ABZ793_12285 [Micromonospora sp. NPDC047465]|uniref:hypothetical protein n=1 Tax=Micromonospora sp. NPDC047465 TaxID=3154813 RepID=UPI0033DBEF7A